MSNAEHAMKRSNLMSNFEILHQLLQFRSWLVVFGAIF